MVRAVHGATSNLDTAPVPKGHPYLATLNSDTGNAAPDQAQTNFTSILAESRENSTIKVTGTVSSGNHVRSFTN
jgi:hypothetical protein